MTQREILNKKYEELAELLGYWMRRGDTFEATLLAIDQLVEQCSQHIDAARIERREAYLKDVANGPA